MAISDQSTIATPAWTDEIDTALFVSRFKALVRNVGRVIRGKDDVVRDALVCLISEGHLLIEDVPGVGKTSLAKAIAESIEGTLSRIQFTPDLLPSDVTGVQVFNQVANKFEFFPGPVFANVVLGDEINRASPKTQSALLEVMEEHQVTVDGVQHIVPEPFMVVATQNPIEQEGTYPLPEAQLDRFMMRISVGYPSPTAELEVIDELLSKRSRPVLEAVVGRDELTEMIELAETVYIAPKVREYIIGLTAATRRVPQLRLGASPRGSMALARTSRTLAASRDRGYVVPEDVKTLAPLVLGHRLLVSPEAELQGVTASAVLAQILDAVPVPRSAD